MTASIVEPTESSPTHRPRARKAERRSVASRERRTLAEVEDSGAVALRRLVGAPSAHGRRLGRAVVRLFRTAGRSAAIPRPMAATRSERSVAIELQPARNCSLGVNLVIGERVWDVEGKIRIRVGPLDYEQFVEFLPYRGSRCEIEGVFSPVAPHAALHRPDAGLRRATAVARRFGPRVHPLRPDGPGLRLGWNTWLRSGKLQGCVKDAVFEGQEVFDLTGSRQD